MGLLLDDLSVDTDIKVKPKEIKSLDISLESDDPCPSKPKTLDSLDANNVESKLPSINSLSGSNNLIDAISDSNTDTVEAVKNTLLNNTSIESSATGVLDSLTSNTSSPLSFTSNITDAVGGIVNKVSSGVANKIESLGTDLSVNNVLSTLKDIYCNGINLDYDFNLDLSLLLSIFSALGDLLDCTKDNDLANTLISTMMNSDKVKTALESGDSSIISNIGNTLVDISKNKPIDAGLILNVNDKTNNLLDMNSILDKVGDLVGSDDDKQALLSKVDSASLTPTINSIAKDVSDRSSTLEMTPADEITLASLMES